MRAKRIDANQTQVISALRAAGAFVWIIGLPVDLLVGYQGQTFLMEIKSGPKKPFTPLQLEFFEGWKGGTLCKVEGPESALKTIGAIK